MAKSAGDDLQEPRERPHVTAGEPMRPASGSLQGAVPNTIAMDGPAAV